MKVTVRKFDIYNNLTCLLCGLTTYSKPWQNISSNGVEMGFNILLANNSILEQSMIFQGDLNPQPDL